MCVLRALTIISGCSLSTCKNVCWRSAPCYVSSFVRLLWLALPTASSSLGLGLTSVCAVTRRAGAQPGSARPPRAAQARGRLNPSGVCKRVLRCLHGDTIFRTRPHLQAQWLRRSGGTAMPGGVMVGFWGNAVRLVGHTVTRFFDG